MAQWEEKLGAILNNPQAMSQIMSIAQSLGASPDQQDEMSQVETVQSQDQDQSQFQSPPPPVPELDPKVMEVGMRALAAWQEPGDTRSALLQALRPLMKEERRGKVDKAIQITRLSKVVRAVLDGWQEGEN